MAFSGASVGAIEEDEEELCASQDVKEEEVEETGRTAAKSGPKAKRAKTSSGGGGRADDASTSANEGGDICDVCEEPVSPEDRAVGVTASARHVTCASAIKYIERIARSKGNSEHFKNFRIDKPKELQYKIPQSCISIFWQGYMWQGVICWWRFVACLR